MKIYTYYDNINFSDQEELIDLWKLSWSRRGFDPVVLSLSSAQSHPYYDEFLNKIKYIVKTTTGKDCSPYGLSCWVRWMAYASQEEEKFYVSDYDAINVNFPITEPKNTLHLMDAHVPFFASGTPKQFENLCKAFVNVSNERIEILKQQANHYHDQEFFLYNFTLEYNDSAEDLRNKHDILMTRNRQKLGGYIDPVENKIFSGSINSYFENEKYGVVHISHHNIGILQEKYTQYKNQDASQLRIDLIKNLLKIQ